MGNYAVSFYVPILPFLCLLMLLWSRWWLHLIRWWLWAIQYTCFLDHTIFKPFLESGGGGGVPVPANIAPYHNIDLMLCFDQLSFPIIWYLFERMPRWVSEESSFLCIIQIRPESLCPLLSAYNTLILVIFAIFHNWNFICTLRWKNVIR